MSNINLIVNDIILSTPGFRTTLISAVVEALGEAYDCTRVWSAWSHNTMGPDDFQLVGQDQDRVSEIVDSIVKVLIENLPKTGEKIYMPQSLLTNTSDLVLRFASAAAEKLYRAEIDHGYTDGWMNTDWLDECREKLNEAVVKGDPLDVAIYSMFLWHHGESTSEPKMSTKSYEELLSAANAHNHFLTDHIDTLDADVFTGDALHNEDCRNVLSSFCHRWLRQIKEMESLDEES